MKARLRLPFPVHNLTTQTHAGALGDAKSTAGAAFRARRGWAAVHRAWRPAGGHVHLQLHLQDLARGCGLGSRQRDVQHVPHGSLGAGSLGDLLQRRRRGLQPRARRRRTLVSAPDHHRIRAPRRRLCGLGARRAGRHRSCGGRSPRRLALATGQVRVTSTRNSSRDRGR